MIISKSELSKVLKISPDATESMDKEAKIKLIQEERERNTCEKWSQISKKTKQLKSKHDQAIKLFKNIISGNNQEVKKQLIEYNKVPEPPVKQVLKTLIGIDATASMEESLKELSRILPNAF